MAKVLVIDDEEELRNLWRENLAEVNIEIIEATNGSDGLRALESKEVFAVICDIQMPLMDGVEFLKILKAKAEYKNLAVFMISGGTDYSDEMIVGLGQNVKVKERTPQDLECILTEIVLIHLGITRIS